jgi:hypothetical protein
VDSNLRPSGPKPENGNSETLDNSKKPKFSGLLWIKTGVVDHALADIFGLVLSAKALKRSQPASQCKGVKLAILSSIASLSLLSFSSAIAAPELAAPVPSTCDARPVIQAKAKEMIPLIRRTHYEYGFFVYEQGGVCKATELFTSGDWDKLAGRVQYPENGKILYYIHSHPSYDDLTSHVEYALGDIDERQLSDTDKQFIRVLQSKIGYSTKYGIVTNYSNYNESKFYIYEFNNKFSLNSKEAIQ